MGDADVPSAILVISVAIPLHAMFICTLVGRVPLWRGGCWGSCLGFGIGSVLPGGLRGVFFGGVSFCPEKNVSLIS